MFKYGRTHRRSREIHVLRDGELTYCGKEVVQRFGSFVQIRKEIGAGYGTCQTCLRAKHSTDVGQNAVDIATSGNQ